MRGWTWLNRLDSQNPNQGSIFVNRGPKEWVHFEWFPHHRVSFFVIYSIMKGESNGVNPVFCMERSLILCGLCLGHNIRNIFSLISFFSCICIKTCIYKYNIMSQIQIHKSAKKCAQEMGGACIGMRTRVINRVISRIYDEALRPHGIKGSQMSILAVISGFGRAEPSEICRLLQLDASTLSRNVSRMKRKGWLNAAPRGDRRAHRLELTAEGERIIVEAFPSWQGAQDKVTETLGKENAAAIRKVARTLRAKAVEF